MENLYRGSFKFPPKMFEGAELIDFGAGTGENTVYLANWGAKCTLVEMNDKAQRISKEVFSKYVKNPKNHNFVLSSIFEYSPKEKKQYDIVHCRGVLSHTSEKEEAFKIISSYGLDQVKYFFLLPVIYYINPLFPSGNFFNNWYMCFGILGLPFYLYLARIKKSD